MTGTIARSRQGTGNEAVGMSCRTLLEAVPDPVLWLAPDGMISGINGRVGAAFGYARKELIGRPAHLLLPEMGVPGCPARPDGQPGERTVGPSGSRSTELAARRKDGTAFPVEVSVTPVDIDGDVLVVVVIRDLTRQAELLSALRDSEERPRQIAENISAAFVLRQLDPPAFLYVSAAYQKIFGYDPMAEREDPQVGLTRIHPDDRERVFIDYWEQSRIGQPAHADFRIIRPDGEQRWVFASSAPVIDPDGVARRCAVTVEDITARKDAEAALRAARVDAETANTAKNEFLSRMSHELRTPLNAVLGFGQLLEMDELTDDQHDAVRHILRGGQHLLALINDVLDIAKIESDRLDMSIEPVGIGELLTETVQLMAPMASASTITLHYQPNPADDGTHVLADRRRLRQVVLNLLSNAIKYNRTAGRVDLRCQPSGSDRWDIQVTDTGRGIRDRDLPRLFTPFDRLAAAGGDIEGTGVGLALSQRLMMCMGGALNATSRIAVGSTFTATIPLAAPPQPAELPDPIEHRSTQQPESAAAVRATHTLLYIEDNSSNIKLMEQLVRRRPRWELVIAGHGHLGLELAASIPFDLVLLDLHLPDMDGLEVLHRLRADLSTSTIPIVMTSADANPHQIERVLAAGATHYLTKPLTVTDIFQLLDDRTATSPRDN